MLTLMVAGLSFNYEPETPFAVQALDKVSFRIASGEVLGLVGPSGAGKSCLLRCLAGVLTPAAGSIRLLDQNGSPVTIRPGLVIQEPEQQFFNETVQSEVGVALLSQHLDRSQALTKVKASLAEVGYEGLLESSPFALSGGQQRKVALASVLIMQPDLILLDEPTVGLDANGIAGILALINRARKAGQNRSNRQP